MPGGFYEFPKAMGEVEDAGVGFAPSLAVACIEPFHHLTSMNDSLLLCHPSTGSGPPRCTVGGYAKKKREKRRGRRWERSIAESVGGNRTLWGVNESLDVNLYFVSTHGWNHFTLTSRASSILSELPLPSGIASEGLPLERRRNSIFV